MKLCVYTYITKYPSFQVCFRITCSTITVFFPTCFYIVTVTLYLQIDCLSRAEVKVSHCPAAAMRMLGFAPIREMMDAGICVSLGTDGAPSNNRMSIGSKFLTCLASFINLGSHYPKKKKSCFSIPA